MVARLTMGSTILKCSCAPAMSSYLYPNEPKNIHQVSTNKTKYFLLVNMFQVLPVLVMYIHSIQFSGLMESASNIIFILLLLVLDQNLY